MSSCSCIKTSNSSSTATVSSAVTYDGESLCINFTSGNLNELISALSEYVCALSVDVSTLTLDSTKVTINSTIDDCITISSGSTLQAALEDIITELCNLKTTVSTLDTSDIVTVGLTAGCTTVTNGETLTSALNKLITKICRCCSSALPRQDFYSIGGNAALPLAPYLKDTLSVVDASSGGTPKVTIGAMSFFADSYNIDKTGETLTLTPNADNYIYLNQNTATWDYAVSPVSIGAAAPTTTGVKVVYVTTTGSGVETITQLIADYPIDNSLLADNCIDARNFSSDVVSDTGAIGFDVLNALKVEVDNDTIDISANKIRVKPDGIGITEINSEIAGDGLEISGGGSIAVKTTKSITTSGGSLQLLNDETSPGVFEYFGTNGIGTKGWHESPIYYGYVKLTESQINSLNTTPITLIPAPGANKYVQVVDCCLYADFTTNIPAVAYTLVASDKLKVSFYGYTSYPAFDFRSSVLSSATSAAYRSVNKSYDNINPLNTRIIISLDNDPTYDGTYSLGNGILTIFLWYKVVDVTVLTGVIGGSGSSTFAQYNDVFTATEGQTVFTLTYLLNEIDMISVDGYNRSDLIPTFTKTGVNEATTTNVFTAGQVVVIYYH